MQLPVMPPVSPMLAKSEPDVPLGDFLYEPKWDGFGRFSSCGAGL
jgi:ATP-dependent DNA ligase